MILINFNIKYKKTIYKSIQSKNIFIYIVNHFLFKLFSVLYC